MSAFKGASAAKPEGEEDGGDAAKGEQMDPDFPWRPATPAMDSVSPTTASEAQLLVASAYDALKRREVSIGREPLDIK